MFFKGLCLLFLPNVPKAMFIQGAKSIPESRVPETMASPLNNITLYHTKSFKMSYILIQLILNLKRKSLLAYKSVSAGSLITSLSVKRFTYKLRLFLAF